MSIEILDRDTSYKKEVVERLEKLLRAAQNGEILCIAYACERPDGSVTVGSSRMKDRYAMLGYLTYLQFMTSLSIHEDAVPSGMTED